MSGGRAVPWRCVWVAGWLACAAAGSVGCGRADAPKEATEPPRVEAATLDAALAGAIGTARERVVAEPDRSDAWGGYGQVLEAAEFFAEARVCYSNAAARDPRSARWVHLLGLLQLRDEPEVAFVHLARAAELDSGTNNPSRLRLAQALVERGRFPEAVGHLERVLAAWPEHAAAKLELARVRFNEQRYGDASDLLSPCLTNPYTARPAALLLSQVRAREGRGEEANLLSRRAAALRKPFDWPDPFQREVQRLRGDRARRAEQIQEMLAQGRRGDAEAALTTLLQSNPDDAEGLLLHGRLLLQQRKCSEAEQRFREHLRVAGDTVNGQMQLALSLLCQKRWGEAEAVLGRVLELKPDFAEAFANRAVARSRQGDSAGAIAGYRDALRCSPGEVGFHVDLAEELSRAGQVREALEQTHRALAIDPNQARARALLERLKAK